jgi:hypothetical protein
MSQSCESFRPSCARNANCSKAVMEVRRNDGGSQAWWKFAGMMEVRAQKANNGRLDATVRSEPHQVLSANELNQLCVLCAFSSLRYQCITPKALSTRCTARADADTNKAMHVLVCGEKIQRQTSGVLQQSEPGGIRTFTGLESHHLSDQSSHDAASILEEADSQPSRVGSRDVTLDTSVSVASL